MNAEAEKPNDNVVRGAFGQSRPEAAVIPNVTAERIADLKAQGVMVDVPPFAQLELAEPGYGEVITGELTAEEKDVYAVYYAEAKRLERMSRDIQGDLLMKAGEAVKTANEDKFLSGDKVTMKEAQEYFRLERRVAYLKSMLFWALGERYNIHDYAIGVRSKGRVVRGERKW